MDTLSLVRGVRGNSGSLSFSLFPLCSPEESVCFLSRLLLFRESSTQLLPYENMRKCLKQKQNKNQDIFRLIYFQQNIVKKTLKTCKNNSKFERNSDNLYRLKIPDNLKVKIIVLLGKVPTINQTPLKFSNFELNMQFLFE